MTRICLPYTRHRPPRTERGASLIEVLVAALILAVGMLAMVGMQASASQMGKIAQLRGDANRISQDYADRVRANFSVANSYNIAGTYTGTVNIQSIPAPCASTCTPAQLSASIAAIDVAEMRNQAQQSLPNGDLRVQNAIVNGSTIVNIWVLWQVARTQSDQGTAGLGCPANVVTSSTPTQCLLTRVAL